MLKRVLRQSRKGFTLIELVIVMTIIGILVSIAVPNYRYGLIRAKESVLQENLFNIRSTIDQFYADHSKYPDSLEELVDKRYLRSLPKDPFTGASDWAPVSPPPPPDGGEIKGSVYDVHSTSPLVGLNGTPYRDM